MIYGCRIPKNICVGTYGSICLKDIFNFTETFAQHDFNRRLMFFFKKMMPYDAGQVPGVSSGSSGGTPLVSQPMAL